MVNYLDSRRISGLSSDTKPTNVETNSIFVETDTALRYWFNGNYWNLPSDKLGIFTGTTAANVYTDNYELYTISSNTWDSSNTLTTGRSRMSGAGDPNNAYVIAGQNGSGYVSTINKINWSTKTETTNSDFTYAPASTGANSDTFCMIMSYYYISYYANSRKVSFSNLTSTSATSIAYTGAWATAFGNKSLGFIANNQNGSGTNNFTSQYTYSSDTVTTKTTSPTSVRGYGGHAGNKSTGVIYSSTDSARHTYDIASDTWESSAFTSLPTRKADTAVCSTFEDFYAIGTSGTTTVKMNYASNTLTTLASHGTSRAGTDTSAGISSNNYGVNY
jgi:hypothetical protein